MKMKYSMWLAVAALYLAGGALAASYARSLVMDDLYRIENLSDLQVAPDGNWLAYLVNVSDRAADETRTSLWLTSLDGKQNVALTAPSDDLEKPRFSPDGRYISFIGSSDAQKGQLMLLDRRGGAAQAVPGANGVVDYAWSADGKHIAFVTESAEDGGAHPKPIVIEAIHFKQDGDGYLGAGNLHHLYIADLDAKKVRPLTQDSKFNDENPAFSPDGTHVAFVRTHERGPDQDGQADIDVIDTTSGEVKTLLRTFAPNNQNLAFSPDGKYLAFLEGKEPKLNAYMQDRLFVVAASGGMAKALSDKLDRAVMSYAFEDADHIAVAIEDDRSVYPARITIDSDAIEKPDSLPKYSVSSIASGGGRTALLKTDDGSFAEAYALEHGQLRKITGRNDALLAELKLGPVEELNFKSEGNDIHGLLVKPPDFSPDKKYPLILWIHGGPNGQDQHSLSIDGYEFEPQIFAAKGYLILRINYRGGSGRGLAFASTILADWGHKEVIDLLAGVTSISARPYVDKDRLAVGGWSYGGLLTDYTIASDRRFKAAICGAGSGDQVATFGSDEYVLQYNHELGPPWVNTPLWLKVSYPFFHADRIHTPTLFLGGKDDFNVPIIGGEQMYEALRTLGVPARLIVYPGEHHVFTRPSFVLDLEARMSAWLTEYVH
ncbi:MAG TPA: S9 family peptidase [Steroidobacteraceae bacterium]|jgi:dipeptidyl aminopeptidase/acylaminoacyl peptidase